MIKSIKTGIILLAALLLAWLLPWCYAFVFASPSWSPFTLYSCVTHGFASVDFDRENNVAGRDLQGNTYTQQQFDSILPTFYYRQLAAEGRFPSEIEGVAVESRDVERTNFMFRTSPGEINRRRPTVYQLLESMPDRIDLEPATDVFRITGVGMVAGCYVTGGKMQRGAQMRLLRDNIVIYDGAIASLQRFKDSVKEVAQGYECGITFEKFQDIKEGDVIEAYLMEQIEV